MQLVKSGTCAVGSTVTYKDGGWRTAKWTVVNLTSAQTVVSFKDKDGNVEQIVTIPAANSFPFDVWGDFRKITVDSGATVSYMVFQGE